MVGIFFVYYSQRMRATALKFTGEHPSNYSPDDQQLDLLLYYPSNVPASAARMISPQNIF
jgi:hypothetical protein